MTEINTYLRDCVMPEHYQNDMKNCMYDVFWCIEDVLMTDLSV